MKKKKNIIIKIIGGSTIIMTVVAMTILIAVLMIFDFFGSNLTKEKVENNLEYGDAYLEAVNENIRYGYVPLQRILYFRLEDETLTWFSLWQRVEATPIHDCGYVYPQNVDCFYQYGKRRKMMFLYCLFIPDSMKNDSDHVATDD